MSNQSVKIPHSRPLLGSEEKKACARVLDSGYVASGPQVAAFEKAFARICGRKYAVAVSSGTAALALALQALRLPKGKQAAVPSYTCAALLHALDYAGLKPLVADIDSEDMNLSAVDLRRRIKARTAAIIVPHLFGRAADMRALGNLGLPVIEDGTQALGAEAAGRPVGSFGEMSIFSFYATKLITSGGEGGMIVTDSARLASRLRDLIDYDKKEIYRTRMNFKMSDLQAAVGLVQLKKLSGFLSARRRIAERYDLAFAASSWTLPAASPERDSVYFRYVLRIPGGAQRFLRKLNEQGIEAKRPIFKPLHRSLGLSDKSYPETVRAFHEACSLPIFPGLSPQQVQTVIRAMTRRSP